VALHPPTRICGDEVLGSKPTGGVCNLPIKIIRACPYFKRKISEDFLESITKSLFLNTKEKGKVDV
jgi:hypothetical protein